MSLRSRKESRRRHAVLLKGNMSTAAEYVEQRMLLSAMPIDGTGNNPAHPEWGSTEQALLRLAQAEYADAIAAVGGEDRPSARLISNLVSDSHGETIISDRLMSAMIYTWGQFIDHDLTLTASGETERMSIPVPAGDASFDPMSTGTKSIDTMRSAFDQSTGTDASNPRQQINLITAFLDGSMVYGSDPATAESLRTFSNGMMKTSDGNLLPLGDDGMFLAGDVRVNENPGLTSLQTLFVREHNYQAAEISKKNASLNDEQVYQKARSVVVAEIQAITYNEWLPSLLGRGAIGRYAGYDASVNPGISNEFATAGFRFGHSLLGDQIEFFDNNGQPIREAVSLSSAFFNPDLVSENGIDSVLKYLASDPSSEVDTQVVDGVRNFLFGPPGAGGLDLASLNIQRGRDHGLADYNETRAALGLPKVQAFSDITSDKELEGKLKSLYGSVDNVDLWVGGLAEDHVRGSSVGETFQQIIVDQFERLRDGDRYWFQNQFAGKQLAQLQKTSLSDIIERNTDLTTIQQNAFMFRAGISGVVVQDLNGNRRAERMEPAADKTIVRLISLLDDELIAETKTNRRGEFRFGVEDGLRTGTYRIVAVRSDGTRIAAGKTITISGGDDFERQNLLVRPSLKTEGSMSPPKRRTASPAQFTEPGSSTQSATATLTRPSTKNSSEATKTRAAKISETSAANQATNQSPAKTSTVLSSMGSPLVGSNSRHRLLDSLFETLPPGLL